MFHFFMETTRDLRNCIITQLDYLHLLNEFCQQTVCSSTNCDVVSRYVTRNKRTWRPWQCYRFGLLNKCLLASGLNSFAASCNNRIMTFTRLTRLVFGDSCEILRRSGTGNAGFSVDWIKFYGSIWELLLQFLVLWQIAEQGRPHTCANSFHSTEMFSLRSPENFSGKSRQTTNIKIDPLPTANFNVLYKQQDAR